MSRLHGIFKGRGEQKEILRLLVPACLLDFKRLKFELQLHVNEFCVSCVFDHNLFVLMTIILAIHFLSSDCVSVITIHTKYIRHQDWSSDSVFNRRQKTLWSQC